MSYKGGYSQLPYQFQNEVCELGIYSVGQQVTIGPIVYACCFSPAKDAVDLVHYYQLKDNAALKEQDRVQKFEIIKKLNYSKLGYFIKVFHPREISNEILRDSQSRENITTISYKTIKKLIRMVLQRRFQISQVYIGNCKIFSGSFQSKFYKDFPNLNFQFDRKTIHNIPTLSCASILSRIYREQQLWRWKYEESREFSRDFGLGLPSVPKTLMWLQECKDVIFGYPSVVRFSHEHIQKTLYFECIRINWHDIYNLHKGENEAEAFEVPQIYQSDQAPAVKEIIERKQNNKRFSYADLTLMTRNFRL